MTKFFFAAGPGKTSASLNDGSLGSAPPTTPDAKDSRALDYSIKVFEEGNTDKFRENSRTWKGDMEKSTDSKGMTYTSAPLNADMQITGTPVIHLWAASTSTDGYFFAFLEEVDGKTKMTLRHAGFPPGEHSELAEAGWNGSFDKLAASLR